MIERMSEKASSSPSQAEKPRAKGPWLSRLAIKILTFVVGVLIYWLLGFVVDDIGSVRGPDYQEIEKSHLDAGMVEREGDLTRKLTETNRLIEKQSKKQALLSQSSQGLQKTMGQLLELQKLSLEKNLALSAEQSKSFNDSLEVFLSNQQDFQRINEEIASLTDKQQSLEDEQAEVRFGLDEQREPARAEYQQAREEHLRRLALYKLLVLVPLFIVGVWTLLRLRGHTYFPLVLAFAGATSLKMLGVMHEHFPARWFKYLLILIVLLGAARLLIYFIRSIVAPKRDKLLRQYRDAYEKFLCPVCEYPIRRGPMKYLYWTRRSLKKLRLPDAVGGTQADESYTCPSCSTELFNECPSCHAIRPGLLPFCDHCGASGDSAEA
jgi:hypothetical protein